MKRLAHILLTTSVFATVPASAQDKAATSFGFDDAVRIASAAVKSAETRRRPISIVVANREGRVLVAMRMDGTSFVNLEVAQAKAATAAALGAPTAALEGAIDGGKASLLTVEGLSAIGGGIPVLRSGKVVGGIGVSGGSPEEDQAAAQAAIN